MKTLLRRAAWLLAGIVVALSASAATRTIVIDSGGTARVVKNDRLFVVDSGGTTRKVTRLFVIDSGGTARQVYQNAVYSVPIGGVTDETLSGTATASVFFSTAGAWSMDGTTSGNQGAGNWVTPTSLAPGSYTIRAHVDSGAALSGAAVDTDLALTSARLWSLVQSGSGSASNTVTFTLKDGGGATLATDTVSFSATVLM